jgi:osmotically-inducible protein OsmY
MGAVNSAPRAEQEALLAHRVSCALADRFQGIGRDISVLVIGGVIHLEGLVGNRDEMAEAEEIARQVSGAQIVVDDLRVASGQSGPRPPARAPSA